MIVAVVEQSWEWFTPMGPFPAPPPYRAPIEWWHWYCTTCRQASKPRAMFSGARGALEMGEHHELRYQCHDGQLSLFDPAVAA